VKAGIINLIPCPMRFGPDPRIITFFWLVGFDSQEDRLALDIFAVFGNLKNEIMFLFGIL
jgi:hypothetical protein